ncbi:hypothetical protein ABFS83_14G273600 [Erythranthe nasuta]
MAQTAKYAMENEIGCGFMGSLFHLKGLLRPKNTVMLEVGGGSPHSKKRQPLAGENFSGQNPPEKKPIPVRRPRVSDAARKSSSSSSNNSGSNKSSQLTVPSLTKPPADEELSLALSDQAKFDPNGAHYRASTGNVMLLGHLGNIKQLKRDSTSDLPKVNIAKKVETGQHQLLGNIVRNSPRNKSNPDVIKSLGNEKYKQGKYEEALALYDRSISVDPTKACYYSNKSAALVELGRFVEAVFVCREAIRIDSSYLNAHFRLAKLYLRLGEAEEAINHYKCSGRKSGPENILRAQDLKNCLDKCIEARNLGDWKKLLNETNIAFSLGSDSAPQIYAMKAEALIGLRLHEEAYKVIQNAPMFTTELYAELFGSSVTAGLLQVHALVYMANGRFEDAAGAVEQALKLDNCSNSIKLTAERVRCVGSARINGNRLFKGSRYSEALVSYNKGLEKDPHNSVLLCNRGACRYKLGQYEKAVEDCTAALVLRPSYSKARLRRANSNAQLEKWGAAIQDYEMVMQEIPGDEDVSAAFSEAKIQLNKMHNTSGSY